MPIELKPVASSAIAAFGYDPDSRTLAVQLTSGKRYDYAAVPPETAEAFEKAESLGRAYGSLIRGKFALVTAPAAEPAAS